MPDLVVLTAYVTLSQPAPHDCTASGLLDAIWRLRGKECRGIEVKQHPAIVLWLTTWQALGVSAKDYPPSLYSLLRRAASVSKAPRINGVVNWYNYLSLELLLPFGTYDLDSTQGGLLPCGRAAVAKALPPWGRKKWSRAPPMKSSMQTTGTS